MSDYQVLKTELALPEYVGLSDEDAATHFNSKTIPVTQPLLSVGKLREWSASVGARKSIQDASTSGDPVIASIALSILDLLKGNGDPLDVSSSNNQAMLGALVQTGVLTPTQQASLLAMASGSAPYYTTVFGVPVSSLDIAYVRSL